MTYQSCVCVCVCVYMSCFPFMEYSHFSFHRMFSLYNISLSLSVWPGVSQRSFFLDMDDKTHNFMMQLNFNAPRTLTGGVLPGT